MANYLVTDEMGNKFLKRNVLDDLGNKGD